MATKSLVEYPAPTQVTRESIRDPESLRRGHDDNQSWEMACPRVLRTAVGAREQRDLGVFGPLRRRF